MIGKDEVDVISKSRRELMIGAGAVAAASMALPLFSSSGTAGAASAKHPIYPSAGEADRGNKIVTKDGVEIFYKDWGKGQPIVFSHGWPLSADDWDAQMLFFVEHGYRVIAHDRRGHGRSTQTADGNDMNHYAADLADLTEALDIRNAVHIGHSTGGRGSCCLRSASWHEADFKDRSGQRSATGHGEERAQPRRNAD